MASRTATQASQSISLSGENPAVHRGPVTASLNFYTPPPDGSAPFDYVHMPPDGLPRQNYSSESQSVTITDLRDSPATFTLAKNAFAIVNNLSSAETEFASDDHIKSVYYPEVEETILKNVPSAKRVFLFDYTVRRANPNAVRRPVVNVHVDQTPWASAQRIQHHLPDEADELLKGRYRIINVWRPINGEVESYPLAFADVSTVADEDLVAIEHRYPDRIGQTAGVKYNPKTNWFYMSGIDNHEALLLQCFDSEDITTRVPHAAFVDPRSGDDAKLRESIEVRALVFG